MEESGEPKIYAGDATWEQLEQAAALGLERLFKARDAATKALQAPGPHPDTGSALHYKVGGTYGCNVYRCLTGQTAEEGQFIGVFFTTGDALMAVGALNESLRQLIKSPLAAAVRQHLARMKDHFEQQRGGGDDSQR